METPNQPIQRSLWDYGGIVTDASQWQSFIDDCEYVEYTDHQEIVNLYAAEVRRLRKYIDEVLYD